MRVLATGLSITHWGATMDYAEILIRIDEQRKAAQKAFLSKNVGRAEVCALEVIRLGVKLLDAAEAFTDSRAMQKKEAA